MPSYTIKYGPHQLQQLDIYVHQGNTQALVIIYIPSGMGGKINVKVAAQSWLQGNWTTLKLDYPLEVKKNQNYYVRIR